MREVNRRIKEPHNHGIKTKAMTNMKKLIHVYTEGRRKAT